MNLGILNAENLPKAHDFEHFEVYLYLSGWFSLSPPILLCRRAEMKEKEKVL